MSYRIQFAQLSNNVTTEQAKTILTTKLKLSDAKATQFLAGKLIFSPISQDKAIKQQKTFSALGIKVKIVNANKAQTQEPEHDVDQRILAALDYITTSIIHLEEKVDDLARLQQEQNGEIDLELENNSWGEELEFDETAESNNKPKNINWLFFALIAILLSLLGVIVAFPNLLPF